MINHSFDIDLASKYGVEEAILIHHFQHWCRYNRRLGRNFVQGRTWTFQTREEIAAHFPYFDKEKVRRLCEKLVKRKILITGRFNANKMKKTLWYAFADEEAFSINVYERQNCHIEGQNCHMYNDKDTIPNDTEFSKENDIVSRDARKAPTSPSFSKKKNLAPPSNEKFVFEDGSVASASGYAYLQKLKRENLPRYERSIEFYRKWVSQGKEVKTTHEKLLQWIIKKDLGEEDENASRNAHYAKTMIEICKLKNISFSKKAVHFIENGRVFESINLSLNCDTFKLTFNKLAGI